jgi:hypothetical protein
VSRYVSVVLREDYMGQLQFTVNSTGAFAGTLTVEHLERETVQDGAAECPPPEDNRAPDERPSMHQVEEAFVDKILTPEEKRAERNRKRRAKAAAIRSASARKAAATRRRRARKKR